MDKAYPEKIEPILEYHKPNPKLEESQDEQILLTHVVSAIV
jgi:hypothetical protein